MLAKAVSFPYVSPVDVGEAFEVHNALQWLSDMQFDNIDFEVDSNITLDAFHSTCDNISEFRCIITSCRSLFNSYFTNSRVEFSMRQANVATHTLVGEATFLVFPAVYFCGCSCACRGGHIPC